MTKAKPPLLARGLGAALGLAGLLAPISASAATQEHPVVPMNDIFTAYRAICVANPGDQAAQNAAALAAPYNMKQGADDSDGTKVFDGPALSLRTLNDGTDSLCMVMAQVDSATTVQQGQNLGSAVFGNPATVTDTNVVWDGSKGSQEIAYVHMLMPVEGGKVGAFILGVRK